MRPDPRAKSEPLVYLDPRTPKICATCLYCAQAGDEQWICLKRTKVRDPEHENQPYLVVVNIYANAAQCFFWAKGAELQPGSKLAQGGTIDLSDRELEALSRRR